MNVLDKIRSRGHWEIQIRPARFVRERVGNIMSLAPIIEKSAVHARWPFPVVLHTLSPKIGFQLIEQEYDRPQHIERWRFFQSGQFVDYSQIRYDWDEEPEWMSSVGRKPQEVLGIGDTLFRLTEVFEFAARLSMTEASDEQMIVSVTLRGLRDRILWVDSANRAPMLGEYKTHMREWPHELKITREELVAQPRELAVNSAIDLFRHFGWEPTSGLLRDQQAEWRL